MRVRVRANLAHRYLASRSLRPSTWLSVGFIFTTSLAPVSCTEMNLVRCAHDELVLSAWRARGVHVACASSHAADHAVVSRLEVAAAADLAGVVGPDELLEDEC